MSECKCSVYFGCSQYADDCPRHGLVAQYNAAVANGYIIAARALDRRIKAIARNDS